MIDTFTIHQLIFIRNIKKQSRRDASLHAWCHGGEKYMCITVIAGRVLSLELIAPGAAVAGEKKNDPGHGFKLGAGRLVNCGCTSA